MAHFNNKVVFLTGASSGIGEALAREFSKQGATLSLCARREERLSRLKTELAQPGQPVIAVSADVTNESELTRAVSETRAILGKIDVVIANAGFGVVGNVEKLTPEDYRRQFETNVFGVLNTIYLTLEDLKKSRGTLVLIGSISGHVALPGTSAYSMSKFAVRALAEALTPELRPYGVSVVLISPGLVTSEIRRVDNRGRLHEEVADPIPDWLRMSADQAAKQIVRAIRKKKREQVITLHGKIIVFVKRHFPWLINYFIKHGVRGRAEPH